MEQYILERDIPIFYVAAKSVPEGILPAILDMEARISASAANRIFYGVSGCHNGQLFYWSGANERTPGEGTRYGCSSFTISKGRYLAEMVLDFRKDPARIRATFEKLLSQPGRLENGYCVEIYINDNDVRCMVQLPPE